MKFDDQLAAYLYKNKSLTLEGIGTFTLDDEAGVSNEQEKGEFYPIEFTYNSKSNTEEEIIFFLIKNLGKIEPLIRSDLDYYLSNIKQLLNIGQPYTINGLGTLNKNDEGIYEFTPPNFSPVKEQSNPKRKNAHHNHPVKSKSSASKSFIIVLVVILALSALGGIGWGVLNSIKNQPQPVEVTQQQGQIDTIAQGNDTITSALKKDTEIINIHSQPAVNQPVATSKPAGLTGDSASYKMIFEVTKFEERAHSRIVQLINLHSNAQYDSIPINDSVAYYRLFLMMKIPLADTSRVKDSLQIFFGNKVFMEKQVEPQRR